MKAGTLIKFTLGLGSLAYSAWQLPQLMDKVQGKGGAGPGGAGGAAALLGAISGQPGQPANPMLSLLGGAPQAQAAKPAPAPLEPATPDDLVVFSAGKSLTPEQRAKLLKDAATKAPLKPGAPSATPAKKKPGEKVSTVRKPAGAGVKPGDDPLAGVDEQALVDITRQLQDELAKSKKP